MSRFAVTLFTQEVGMKRHRSGRRAFLITIMILGASLALVAGALRARPVSAAAAVTARYDPAAKGRPVSRT